MTELSWTRDWGGYSGGSRWEDQPLTFQRWGAGLDWNLNDRWVFTAERRAQFGQKLSRLGMRLNLTPLASLDFSVARGEARVFALGFSWEWER